MRPRRLFESKDRGNFAVGLSDDFKRMHARHKGTTSKPLAEDALTTKTNSRMEKTKRTMSERERKRYMYCARRTLD